MDTDEKFKFLYFFFVVYFLLCFIFYFLILRHFRKNAPHPTLHGKIPSWSIISLKRTIFRGKKFNKKDSRKGGASHCRLLVPWITSVLFYFYLLLSTVSFSETFFFSFFNYFSLFSISFVDLLVFQFLSGGKMRLTDGVFASLQITVLYPHHRHLLEVSHLPRLQIFP